MTRAYLLAIGSLLACPVPLEGHALDEYVQATRLALALDRVMVELDLTPGVAIAAQVFALIDQDHDASVVPAEIEKYARRVLRDLTLRMDGRDYPLTLMRADSPSWEEIRDGEGTIRIAAFARITLTNGAHRISYENAHERRDSGVFLVNVLVPTTSALTIQAQHRDVFQRSIDVDVAVSTPPDGVSSGGAERCRSRCRK